MKKIFLLGAVLGLLVGASGSVGAWTMAFSETQKSPNLSLEVEAGKPGSSVGIRGADAEDIVYDGWVLAARPEPIRRLYNNVPGVDERPHFTSFIDNQKIGLVDMDAAVEGHLLAARVDTRARFDMPVLSDAKWSDMRPRDGQGHVLTWETLKRVKSWLGGTGATMTVASLTPVPEPATLALLLAGLVSLIALRRRLRA